MPLCTQCGYQNTNDAKFCSQCGSQLTGSEQAVEVSGDTTSTMATVREESERPDQEETGLPAADLAAIEGLPSDSALLVVLRGPNAGSRFLLNADKVSAGRHPKSDIFLDDVTVSRKHAEFRRGPGGFAVADVGSLNGTYVNRDRIDEVSLGNGDEVQIGKYRLVYYANQEARDGGAS